MLKAQKGKSIFLQLFDISQQIAISSLQGYFSAAENIESQDGLKIWNIQKLNILPRSSKHRTEHGLNILSTADIVMKRQLDSKFAFRRTELFGAGLFYWNSNAPGP